jgi:hypothetical protein
MYTARTCSVDIWKKLLKIDTFKGYVEGIDTFRRCVDWDGPALRGEEFEQCRVFVDDFTPAFLTDQYSEFLQFLKVF